MLELTLSRHLGQDVASTGVHVDELGQVIDGRVDDDPEIVFLVVLQGR